MKSVKKLKINKTALFAIVIIVVCAGAIGGVAIISKIHKESNIAQVQKSLNDGNKASFSNGENDNSIENVAEKLAPSVVSIVSETQRRTSFLYAKNRSQTVASAGTGIIVSSDGYILTNKHVINNSSKVSVVLSDGKTYDDVSVVAEDPASDIAFLKISNVKNLTPAELGDSKTLNIGQQVIAIGNALGEYAGTVTSGIISGVGRKVTAASQDGSMEETLSDMIQTDAAINSGNSGGPLVNAKGQVIGINTAIASQAQGIGFAIPIASVKGMLNSLIEKGTASRAYLGVNYIEITSEVSKEYGLSVKSGALVKSEESHSAVVSGGPAAKAGIKDGDIITKINGVNVGKSGSVSTLVSEYKVGDTIKITILRNNKEQELTATLAAYPSN